MTEAGVIPEDWESRPLSSIGRFKNGINKGSEAFGHGSPFVNLMDVFGVNSIKSCQGLGLVKTSEAEQETYDLKRGDVLFIRSSVKPSGVGLTAVVEVDLPKTVYSGFLIRFRDNNALDISYKKHCFYSEKFRNNLIAASTVSANTNINQDNLKKLFIALPPTIAEQRAIAQALSDVDASLAALDQMITKKRDLKQAAMQQLLTGMTRLPGFSGKWTVRLVKDFGEIVTGGTPSTENKEFWGEGYPWITPTDISTERDMITSERTITNEGLRVVRSLPANTVLVTCIASIGKNAILRSVGGCNQQINAIIPNDDHCAEFLYFLMEANKQYLLSNAGTTATAILSKAAFSEMEFLAPAKPEQTAIAAVLSGIDEELTALESRRDKTRNIKQAMMQELLMGKTRLV